MADMLSNLVKGATVELETAITPAVRVPVDGIASSSTPGPGFLTRLLRPVVVVRRGETVLLKIEPAGTPNRVFQSAAAALLFTLIAWMLFRLVRR